MTLPIETRIAIRHLSKTALRIEQRKGQFPTEFWREVVLRLCKRMGVNHNHLTVKFRKNLGGRYATYGWGIVTIAKLERVHQDTVKKIFESLAHELQHAKQEQTGQHQESVKNAEGESGSMWEGEFYPEDYPYQDQPWEIEARKAGKRYGLPLYREMSSKGEIPLSKQERLRQKTPFSGPTMEDLSNTVSDAEMTQEIQEMRRDRGAWLEKWRERYRSGWRGLEITPDIGNLDR